MGFIAVLAIRIQTGFLLERQQRLFRFRTKLRIRAVLGQRIAQMHQQFLQGLYIGIHHATFQQAASQRNFRCRNICGSFSVLNKGQLVPVLPLALLHLRAHTAIVEPSPFHGIAVADVIAHMTIRVQCQTDDLRQRVNRTPIHALGFCP